MVKTTWLSIIIFYWVVNVLFILPCKFIHCFDTGVITVLLSGSQGCWCCTRKSCKYQVRKQCTRHFLNKSLGCFHALKSKKGASWKEEGCEGGRDGERQRVTKPVFENPLAPFSVWLTSESNATCTDINNYIKCVFLYSRSLLMEKPDIVVGTPSVLLGHVQAKVSTIKNRFTSSQG